VAAAEWEFTTRWAEVADRGLQHSVELLEARDVALEQKLRDGYGTSCFVDFEYPYRWETILTHPEAMQISLLDMRDTALEQAVNAEGGCRLELPYRWAQILPGMVEGDLEAFACAEENDRTIEGRFASCSCGKVVSGSFNSTGLIFEPSSTTVGVSTLGMTRSGGLDFTVSGEFATAGNITFESYFGGTWHVHSTIAVTAGSFVGSTTVPVSIPVGRQVRYSATCTAVLFDPTIRVEFDESEDLFVSWPDLELSGIVYVSGSFSAANSVTTDFSPTATDTLGVFKITGNFSVGGDISLEYFSAFTWINVDTITVGTGYGSTAKGVSTSPLDGTVPVRFRNLNAECSDTSVTIELDYVALVGTADPVTWI
jgi:hypothetical protein